MKILFLIIDTLRYDYTGYARKYANSITPNLDQISQEGLIYNHAFSSGTSTPFSFPGILTSTYSHQVKTPGVKDVPLAFAEYLKDTQFNALMEEYK
ncbi:sulfatase-like hydrolase/transferase [Thermosipho atlanticus]|uniref:Sulfatase n=1 Tax=Thermosipho atlanticus DSM 15807 TaxID=1123380 RepID=A0A1M5RNL6_9BACT|nr:sulfatase-like hydrolase/transferase [Thermosipho atlanticus]SHH27937.1 Sulfatase [Thermosipho atlanticus DSM 15807]